MYLFLLSLHSLFRWLVLISLLFAIIKGYKGWLSHQNFSKFDDAVRLITVTVLHIQFCLGITLYFISPLVSYFLYHFKEAVHVRDIRFFGMEHITMMFLAVVILTIGSGKVKKAVNDTKYKTLAIWFTIGLVIILASIPWPFSPFTTRPYFRMF